MFQLNRLVRSSAVAAALLAMTVVFAGCEEKGPAEKAGENIDNAAKNVKESVNPSGPAEKAGANVDKALKN